MKRLNEVLSNELIEEHISKGYKIIKCPVCDNETFDDYFICPHCDWEYDGIVESDVYSSTNKSTINLYKTKILK